MNERKKMFWLLAVLSTLVIVPFLGETLFYSKGEPREAIVAYTMLQSGNWILPLNYGSDIAFKPPMLYWCIAFFSWLGGGVTEFTSRLPSALSFLAMLWVVYAFFAKRKDVRTAFLTALLLLTSFEVHRAAVACRLDMLQVSLIVISLILLFRWDERGARAFPWLAIVLMAAASLTKGPVGSIFPCLVIGVYQLVRGRNFWKTLGSLAGIGLLSLVPLALWFWAAYRQGGQPFIDLMMEENVGRFTSTMSYESHENPVWYNFLTIAWGWIPWSLVLVLSVFYVRWRNFRFRFKMPPVQLFTWLVIGVIFVFYCIPKSKRSVYLLPIYPFMAVLIAEYLMALAARGVKLFKVSGIIFTAVCLLLTLTFAAVRLDLIPASVWGSGRHAAENIAYMHGLRDVSLSLPQWLLVLLPVIAAVATWRVVAKKGSAHTLLYSIAGCLLTLFVVMDGVYQPTVLGVKSDIHIARRIGQTVPQGPVYTYEHASFYCINFYLHDRMRHFTVEKPAGEGYVALPARDHEKFLKEVGRDYILTELFRTDRRSCDLRDVIYLYRFHRK
ncbi:MAG: glycosyltransferase family 39 protein [Prevotellaceae bacterium]|nr:glycosyltransferase family 39 protein [Prevotellaceae bacterium]